MMVVLLQEVLKQKRWVLVWEFRGLKVRDSFLSQGGKVFSSNFTFYGDMSARVMNILEGFVPRS
jgi:hypothetical protein